MKLVPSFSTSFSPFDYSGVSLLGFVYLLLLGILLKKNSTSVQDWWAGNSKMLLLFFIVNIFGKNVPAWGILSEWQYEGQWHNAGVAVGKASP